MAKYIKINNTWKVVSNFYKKENNNWSTIYESDLNTYLFNNIFQFGGYYESQEEEYTILVIQGLSTFSGETCNFNAICDNGIDVTESASWSIINGSSYCSISQTGVLTVNSSANNSNVTIQASYGSLTETKTIVVTYKSGASSQTETTTTTDESGNTTSTTTTTNSDGSYNSTSTNYDANGNETGHSSETGDTSGNVSTQIVEKDGNGNDVITGYEIDTSDNQNGGLNITDGIDTGVLVFDGHDWTATLKAKILFNDITPSGTQFPIMNVSSRGDDNKLDGAFFLVTRQTSGMGSAVYDENGTQQSTTTSSNPTLKWRIQNYLGGSLQNGVDFYYKNGTRPYYTNRFGSKTTALTLTYKMVYTESNHQLVTEIYDANGTTILAKPRSEAVVTFTRTMSDITFEIGQATNVSGTELKTKLEVIDFHVEKTI